MQLDIKEVEELAKTLYIRALKLLPPDIKRGFERLMAKETDATVKERYAELGSSAPQGADRGPAGLQKLVESEIARITPVIKAANVKVE